MSDHVTKLYDAQGTLVAVLLSPQAYEASRSALADFLPEQDPGLPPEPDERLSDWENLKNYWDFPYPVDTDVLCESCDSRTMDFLADDPRKFLLTAASLSGLVTFYCRQCKAKIIKRHFKDEITSETKPYFASKTFKNEAKHP